MNKPKKQIREYWDYNEISQYVCEKLGYNIRDVNGKFKTKIYEEMEKIEYLDFWHWLIERYDWISNGCYINMPDEIEMEEIEQEWVKPIIAAFKEVVGDEELWVEW